MVYARVPPMARPTRRNSILTMIRRRECSREIKQRLSNLRVEIARVPDFNDSGAPDLALSLKRTYGSSTTVHRECCAFPRVESSKDDGSTNERERERERV